MVVFMPQKYFFLPMGANQDAALVDPPFTEKEQNKSLVMTYLILLPLMTTLFMTSLYGLQNVK